MLFNESIEANIDALIENDKLALCLCVLIGQVLFTQTYPHWLCQFLPGGFVI